MNVDISACDIPLSCTVVCAWLNIIIPKDINKIEGNNIPTANQAKELLKAYRDAAEAEVEKAPKTEPEKKPEEAEKLAKDLLK